MFLFQGHNSPINSGDEIALQSASTRGPYPATWLKCTRASCVSNNCQSSDIANLTGSASCPMIFTIRAKDGGVINGSVINGGVINSGDTVLLSPVNGSGFLLSCDSSTSTKCCVKS